MNQDFFTNLPSEIIINILSRLPVRTIIHCKCVCKSWLDLLETREFVNSHLSKSVPGLVVQRSECPTKSFKFFEFVDVPDLEHHELHYNLVTNIDFPHQADIKCSANGLLFLFDTPDAYYICNPITRDYIKLNCPQEFAYSYPQIYTHGFGASKMTGQHKVVKIFHNGVLNETRRWTRILEAVCQVYTLGTGSWRSLGPGGPLNYCGTNNGLFVNGNLHWLVCDLKGSHWVSCLDLETEIFSTFAAPPLACPYSCVADVVALEDCLCLCDNGYDDKIVIWSMKEYGVEKSWTKEFVINKISHFSGESNEEVHAIKVFKDGDILIEWGGWLMAHYSNKNNTIQQLDMFQLHKYIVRIIHTPSFLSLKNFEMEKVISF